MTHSPIILHEHKCKVANCVEYVLKYSMFRHKNLTHQLDWRLIIIIHVHARQCEATYCSVSPPLNPKSTRIDSLCGETL